VETILKPSKTNAFLRDFGAFQERMAYYGMINGLSQALLKIALPGVPDIYQGSELWDLRLVDPDNRRPVDFENRKALLEALKQASQTELLAFAKDVTRSWRDGRIKLYLIWKALNFRKNHTDLFSRGDLIQVEARGERRENVVAFLRRHKSEWTLIVVPHWLATLDAAGDHARPEQFWGRTEINLQTGARKGWRNLFTGEELVSSKGGILRVGDLLRHFPVAFLAGSRSSKTKRTDHT
jgi:(1->4)-alpha-D-glucan 1-alpha-D-glucosylmutase